jgi:hypothetical protein
MNLPPDNPLESRAVRVTGATKQFERMGDELIHTLRRAMQVPDAAEPEVEQEFAALRESLDAFQPEFTRIYGGMLSRCLGSSASVVLSSLESAPAQAYLEVADRIDADVNALVRAYLPDVAAALGVTVKP